VHSQCADFVQGGGTSPAVSVSMVPAQHMPHQKMFDEWMLVVA